MATNKDIDIPNQTGTRAVVTGANSGISFGVSQRLVAAGAEVILAVRSRDKGNKAALACLLPPGFPVRLVTRTLPGGSGRSPSNSPGSISLQTTRSSMHTRPII